MDDSIDLPGTLLQQQMLQSILDYYAEDARIAAILLFGSLGRGNWDAYSDLDIDIIVNDNVSIDAHRELTNLCASIKRQHRLEALIIADAEEGDVVLSNLLEFSIRYHMLADTKPAILDSMRRLAGDVSLDEIRAAANEDYSTVRPENTEIINQCIRYTLELHHAILRGRVWMSLELLQRIRALLMSIYSGSHGADRPVHFFDAQATPQLQQLMISLAPQAEMEPIKAAFFNALLLLQDHLGSFSNGGYELTEAQRLVLGNISQSLGKKR